MLCFKAKLTHIFSDLRLKAIDCNQVLREGKIEGSLVEFRPLGKLSQIHPGRLDEPQILVLMGHFLIHKWH